MTLRELLRLVVDELEAGNIPYMLTGSLASSVYGEPRATNDIDLVIDPSPEALDGLIERLLRAGLYIDPDAARSALRDRGQFNALRDDQKIDFIVRKDRPFSIVEFQRRRRMRGADIDADIVSPEDLVLVKLGWALESGSDRQLRDVAGMITLAEGLDRAYIEDWASRLGLLDVWRETDRET